MKFLCIVYDCDGPDISDPAYLERSMVQEVLANMKSLSEQGHFIAGSPLDGPSTAVTVRVRNDGVTISDGPFAETKEQVGGFYLIDAGSIEEAARLATTMPPARLGAIEVRPLKEFLPS